jgi:hypothetical protein
MSQVHTDWYKNLLLQWREVPYLRYILIGMETSYHSGGSHHISGPTKVSAPNAPRCRGSHWCLEVVLISNQG